MGNNHLSIAHDDQSLHHILQFPHVSGPGVGFHDFHHFRLQLLFRFPVGSAVKPQKMLDEKGDITMAVAQWGYKYWNDVDSVVEVLSETPQADHFLKIVIGR